MSKITIATVKAFIRKHPEAQIRVNSDFDGMIDCVSGNPHAQWFPLEERDAEHRFDQNTLGYKGLWFVGYSRDYPAPYDDGVMTGYEVTNSCGCWTVAIPRTNPRGI